MLRNALQILTVLIGTVLVSASYTFFFMPHQLVSGGVAGIALLLGQVLGWPVGLQVLVYNVPILAWASRYLGRKFLILTVIGIGALTLFTTLLPVRAVVPDDPLLNAIFGGILCGFGVGLTLRAGGSSGGLDVLMVVFNRRFSLPMSDVMLGFNGLIVVLAGLSGDLTAVLYTLVSMFVTGKLVDLVTSGVAKKTVLVITSRPDEVAHRVTLEMGRGVTVLDGKGYYTGESRSVLLCVITRFELANVKEIVTAADPQAFLAVLETDQVVGRFHTYNPITGVAKPGA